MGTLKYSKYRDWGCFGGMRAELPVPVYAYLLSGHAFLSHPSGLAAVLMDGLNCSIYAPQCVRKALCITTKTSSDSTTSVLFWGFYFSFFQQLKLGKEDKLFRKKVLCLFNRCVLSPFNPFSSLS